MANTCKAEFSKKDGMRMMLKIARKGERRNTHMALASVNTSDPDDDETTFGPR